MDSLSLSEGDEIQMEVSDGQIVTVHACKAVPTALLSDDLLSEIKKQEHRLAQGKGLTVAKAMGQVEKHEKHEKRSGPGSAAGKRRKAAFETQLTHRMSS